MPASFYFKKLVLVNFYAGRECVDCVKTLTCFTVYNIIKMSKMTKRKDNNV